MPGKRPKAPCIDCPTRAPGCHSICAEYIEHIRKAAERCDIINTAKKQEWEAILYRKDAVIKAKKAARR